MKSYLLVALLACSIANGLGQGNFEYTDNQGRCWSCTAGNSCVPCQGGQIFDGFVSIPPTHPRNCPAPDCSIPTNRPILFPDGSDPRFFFQCRQSGNGNWEPVRQECQCDTYFDAELTSCQYPWDWISFCDIINLPQPRPCDPTTIVPTTVPTTFPPTDTTTAPTTTAPNQPCQPCCMPCMIWWMCPPCTTQCNNGCAMG